MKGRLPPRTESYPCVAKRASARSCCVGTRTSRKENISMAKGEKCLFDDVRYFFYITNLTLLTTEQVVWAANHRGNQENLLAQLHGAVSALKAPVNTLESNWAYMVMTALAWNLKAWWALMLPVSPGRWKKRHAE